MNDFEQCDCPEDVICEHEAALYAEIDRIVSGATSPNPNPEHPEVPKPLEPTGPAPGAVR